MQRTDVRIAVAIAASLLLDELARLAGAPPWVALLLALALGAAAAAVIGARVRAPLTDLLEGLRAGGGERARPDSSSELDRLAAAVDREAGLLRDELDATTAQKQQLEAVLGAMVEGVLVLDHDGRVALANPRLRELFDVWGAVEGRRPLEIVRNTGIDEALREAIGSPSVVIRELEWIGPDRRTLLMHASPIPRDGGAAAVAVFHDVSEIRHLEQIRRDFLANASHELRTPLTTIRGYAETLQAGATDDPSLASALQAIERNAQRLSALIDDLLSVSRLESGRKTMQPSEVDIRHLVQLLAEDTAPRLRDAQITLQLELADDAVAWADQGAVEQVLGNLIDNAAKYTEAGGQITVTVAPKGRNITVRVSDTGIGIPAEDRSRIFERFFRVDRARARALGGTGLGLSIVKHLLQAIGGDITVESELGKGSTFEFRLPAANNLSA